MTDETTGSIEAPPVSIDAQDPLPESNWLWRRICLIGTLLFMFVVIGWQVVHDKPVDPWAWYTVMAALILYAVAPSAEQVIRGGQVVKMLLPGNLTFAKTATATTSPTGQPVATSTATVTPSGSSSPAAPLPTPTSDDDHAGELPPEMKVPRP